MRRLRLLGIPVRAVGIRIEGEHVRLDLLARLRAEARQRGLWCPQMPVERGGQGLGPVGMAVVYETLGRSRFGPNASVRLKNGIT